jgi:hypothetical protein
MFYGDKAELNKVVDSKKYLESEFYSKLVRFFRRKHEITHSYITNVLFLGISCLIMSCLILFVEPGSRLYCVLFRLLGDS